LPDDKNIFPRNRTYVWHSIYLILFHSSSSSKAVVGSLRSFVIDRRLYQNQQEKHPDERLAPVIARLIAFQSRNTQETR